MKKQERNSNRERNSKDYLSDDSETDCPRPYVRRSDEQLSYSQTRRSLLRRYNDNKSDCSQEAQYTVYKESKKVCGYCEKGKHSENNCPLFMTAIKQQCNILQTCNASLSSGSKQMVNVTHTETDQQHVEFLQKAQKEYYTKQCKNCKEYGHLEDKCPVLGKNSDRQPDVDWQKIETRKSKRSKIKLNEKNTLETVVCDLNETDHTANDCAKAKENVVEFCHFCKEYGHNENICPLVQKALKKQKGKITIVSPKSHKSKFSSDTAKGKDFRKLKMCHYCGDSDHQEEDCIVHRPSSYKEQVQLNDMCPSLQEDVRKLKNQTDKFYLNGQMSTNDSNSKIKIKHMKTLNKCNFCGDSDHNDSECKNKLQCEYFNKYCHYCDEYGHCEDTCLLIAEAAEETKKQSYCKVSSEYSKKDTFANDVSKLTENLEDVKICYICEDFGHNENDCFVKQQYEFYSKYCDLCKENGHYENECISNKQSSDDQSARSNNFLKKGLEFKIKICSDHCLCEKCHDVYSQEQKYSSKNARNSTIKSSFEANALNIRYCTLCGIKGLIDTCILKEKTAAE